jgi:hypothetical protein
MRRYPFRCDQAHGFVDGDLGLALRVRIDWLDLITLDPAVPVEIVDHDLGAELSAVAIAAPARLVRLLKRFVRFSEAGHEDVDMYGAQDAVRAFLVPPSPEVPDRSKPVIPST